MKKKTHAEFIEQLTARLKETGDLDNYSLSKVTYISESRKISVKCLVHDEEFMVRPNDWLNGARCVKCGILKVTALRKSSLSDLISKASLIHNNAYTYEKFEYKNLHTKGIVTCPTHGDFLKSMAAHVYGKKSGCLVCSGRRSLTPRILTFKKADSVEFFKNRFLSRAAEIHKGIYDYSEVEYIDKKTPVKIKCPSHGIFLQLPDYHINAGSGCPACYPKTSRAELEVLDFVRSNTEEKVIPNIPILGKKHIDIYVPALNLGIEYCGIYYHQDHFKSTVYHRDKFKAAQQLGIQLIQIFEDEWVYNQDIVKSMLLIKLGKSTESTPARKTKIVDVPSIMARQFFQEVHLQGSGPVSSFRVFGLSDRTGKLVSCMAFSSSNMAEKEIELTRFASKGRVQGGFSKLLKHAISVFKEEGFSTISSFSDNRWGDGNVYHINGFVKTGESTPRYWWCKGRQRFHRRLFQRKYLNKKLEVFDGELSESENCIKNGYYKIHDAGVTKWECYL